MNQNSMKQKVKKPLNKVSFVGRNFKLHGVKRKSPILKKLGNGTVRPGNMPISRKILNRPTSLPRGHFKRQAGAKLQNRFKLGPGRRLTTRTYSNGTVEYIPQSVGGVADWMTNVLTQDGDFKHPNPQRFTHHVYTDFCGTYTTNTVSGGVTTISDVYAGDNLYVAPAFAFAGFGGAGNAYNKALGKVYDKLRGDIDISVDLAESHKTKSMMRDTVRSMVSLATTFRKMRRSNPRDWGNLWLEFTYGWKPLVSTVYESGKKLLAPSSNDMGFLRVSESATEWQQRGSDSTVYLASVPAGKYADLKRVRHYYLVNRVRFQLLYQINSSTLGKLAGYTSLNPVSIAWELTPYSFVVDWFVNFGGYLRDFETAVLYQTSFLSGYYTETSLGECAQFIQGSTVQETSPTSQSVTISDMTANDRYTEKRRTVLTSSPFPRAPRFKPHLGTSRLISGAALLGQMLTSLEHSKGYGKPQPRVTLADKARRSAAGRAFERASKDFSDWERELRRKVK